MTEARCSSHPLPIYNLEKPRAFSLPLPGVSARGMEAVVAGILDPRSGEAVKAWIIPVVCAAVSKDEIIMWSKSQLAAYRYPRLVEFCDEPAEAGLGKVLMRELVKEHLQVEMWIVPV